MSTGQGAARLTAQLSAHRVVLIRHAEPEIEPAIPAAEWRLSAAGRDAAASLAGRLGDYSFACVTSSPEPKALETAQAMGAKLGGLPVEVHAGFSEHARRSAGFRSHRDLDAAIAAFFNHRARVVFGEESANRALARFSAALERTLLGAARDIAVVSHGTILSLYVSRAMQLDPLPFWRALPMPAAIVLDAGRMRLLKPG